jgi:hypothetical protein
MRRRAGEGGDRVEVVVVNRLGCGCLDGGHRPLAVTVEIMLIECRVPVVRTIGVCPIGAHVVSEW